MQKSKKIISELKDSLKTTLSALTFSSAKTEEASAEADLGV